MNKHFFTIALLCLLLQACGQRPKKLKDDDIPQGLRTQLNELNTRLVNDLASNNVPDLKNIMSTELVKKESDKMAKLLQSTQRLFVNKDFSVLDEFCVTHIGTEINDTLEGGKGENAYTFTYRSHTSTSYVSLLIIQKGRFKMLLTAIYGKYGSEWKLDNMKIGEYAINDMSPSELVKGSRSFYQKGQLIDACDWVFLALQYSRPANQFLLYNNFKTVKAYTDSVIKQANASYPLPYTFTQISTRPKMFYVVPEITENGFSPMFYYLTTVPLNDTIALKKENDAIQHISGQVFTGIDKNNALIYYRAFNEMPNASKKNVQHYGFVQKTGLKVD